MQIRSLLKKVEARAVLRDFLSASLLAVSSATLLFVILGAADYRFDLTIKTRLASVVFILLSAIAWVALDLIGRARKRGALWAAALVEHRVATLDNQLFALAECEFGGACAPAYLRARMEADLSRRLESITPSSAVRLIPNRAATFSFFSAALICALIFFIAPQAARDEFRKLLLFERFESLSNEQSLAAQPVTTLIADGVEELRVVLSPPAYTRLGPVVQIGDGNIAALAGTRADFYIKLDREVSAAFFSIGGAPAFRMEGEGELSYHASFIVKEDSNCKISLNTLAEPDWKWEAVYAIRAVKDNPPEVHITQPASDLLFAATARPRSLFVEVSAKDDYGVAQVRLKYIKTTGEGDASRFESGEISIGRAASVSEAQTIGSARLDLAAIGAEPGTSVIFHAEAMDRNNVTGPGVGYSENIVLQVVGPEPVKISLDDVRPDEALKYLTSERMILIKTEKLNRQRVRLLQGEVISRSQEIAVEQRRLRESFNQFSEVESASEQTEDHAAEPSGESDSSKLRSAAVPDLPAGASEQAREMILALRAMQRAEGALGAADTAGALAFEREALIHLKEAQKGARYFTDIVARSRPVDLKRRYLGALDDIRSRLERAARKQESPFDEKLRAALVLVYDAARSLAPSKKQNPDSRQSIELARQKIDRASEDMLSIRGEGSSLIVESASKLKLVARMLDAAAGAQTEDAFGLLTQVASEMSAALGRDERRGFAPARESIPMAARESAAKYFKLLSAP